MANFFEQKPRNVIPGFRNFAATIGLGELDPPTSDSSRDLSRGIEVPLEDWTRTKSLGVAADLISCAFTCGVPAHPDVVAAARYVLKAGKDATALQLDVARRLLGSPLVETTSVETNSGAQGILAFVDCKGLSPLCSRIHAIRRALSEFHASPVLIVELARLYSILGQKDKAERCIRMAASLAPENRYVLRSSARFWAHEGQPDRAHELLLGSASLSHDPWLMAAEIGLAHLRSRSPRMTKKGFAAIASRRFSPLSTAELSSALGTLELTGGNRRKARDLFRTALRQPNDNALAQVEWALSVDNFMDLEPGRLRVKRDFEALTLDAFGRQDWKAVLRHAEEWFLDMPFARRPSMLASHVASTILEKHEDTAALFCRAGLIAHPGDPQLLNNLAFALASRGKVDEAERALQGLWIGGVHEASTRICLTATQGLIRFRQGRFTEGRALYISAIDLANKERLVHCAQSALLHQAREEILAGTEEAARVMARVRNLKIDPRTPWLVVLRDRATTLSESKATRQRSP